MSVTASSAVRMPVYHGDIYVLPSGDSRPNCYETLYFLAFFFFFFLNKAWLVYWGLTSQQQPGSYQGSEMVMMKNQFSGGGNRSTRNKPPTYGKRVKLVKLPPNSEWLGSLL